MPKRDYRMKAIKRSLVEKFVKDYITKFHDSRLKRLESTTLSSLLGNKNPYLFRAKNLTTAQELITSLLEAQLSSAEEKIFGDFLESLAIFVAQKRLKATKSSSPGIDLEYMKKGTRFLVSIKSGVNWGNSSQWSALRRYFTDARKVLLQSKSSIRHVETILGICYGKAKTTLKEGNIKQVCGQNFWYMLSGEKQFYVSIIKPLSYRAIEASTTFNTKKAEKINKFTKEFITQYCDENGIILWNKVITFNSKNMTPKDKLDLA